MIFVDTSAWFAAVVPTDSNHPEASRWLAVNSEPLLTTDYIVDETLTLLRARGERQRAKALVEQFFNSSVAEVYFLTEDISGRLGAPSNNMMTRLGVLQIVRASS